MTRKARHDLVLAKLAGHGIGHLAPYITLHEDAEGYDGRPPRAEIALGYHDGKRFRTMTSSNVPSLEDAIAKLEDADEISTMFGLATSFMPKDRQPELPAWMNSKSKADDVLTQMRRVNGLAKAAALVSDEDDVF